MNDFGLIDYKRPLGIDDDMRTSTYRGHLHMTDTMAGNLLDPKFGETRKYEQDRLLNEGRISDYKGNFVWKYCDPNMLRNPGLKKLRLVRNFDDTQMRFIKRPIQPARSISNQDYLWPTINGVEKPQPLRMPKEIPTTRIIIDRNKHGFSKYLDPGATTSGLAYVEYTQKEALASVARNDGITFWNWKNNEPNPMRVFPGHDRKQCDVKKTNECKTRIAEFTSLVQPVPHSGMTTEVRENYTVPYRRAIDYQTSFYNELVHVPVTPLCEDTDNKLYGSGESTQNYVEPKKKR